MESQLQQPEYTDTTSPEAIAASTEAAPLAKLPPASQSEDQLQRIGRQTAAFLADLPDYLGKVFNEYKQPITSVLLIVAAIVTVKVVLAVLDALNDIPLLSPTFELVGIGYSVWFVNRYLLKASSRQELAKEIQAIRGQVAGDEIPES